MINKIILIGRLGHDPETRSTADGKTMLHFDLATSRGKNSKTEWHKVTAFEPLSLSLPSLAKGALAYVEGWVSYGEYTNRNGEKRHTTEIIANRALVLSTPPQSPPPSTYVDDLPF